MPQSENRLNFLAAVKFILLVLLLYGSTLPAQSPETETEKPAGQEKFEKAYQIEKEDPEQAIKLFREAIDAGLEGQLLPAARWRLYYLYKKKKAYPQALSELLQIGTTKKMERIFQSLYSEMRRHWKISEAVLQEYVSGLRLIMEANSAAATPNTIPANPENNTSAVTANKEKVISEHFTRAMTQAGENKPFRDAIIKTLTINGYEALALDYLNNYSELENIRYLLQADKYIKENNLVEAQRIVMGLAYRNSTLRSRDKARLLYLLGTIKRKQDDLPEAIRFYRLAARYAEDEQRLKHLALAAYLLYKNNLPDQALALLRGNEPGDDFNIRLLFLVLRAEVDEDRDSLEKLIEMESLLAESQQNKVSPFITERALIIIEKSRGKE